MSDKDYVQLQTTQFESKRASQATNPKPFLVASLGTALAIICFTAGFLVGEKYSAETTQSLKHEALLASLHKQQKENEHLKQAAEKQRLETDKKEQVGELTFYNELPKQSVMPEPLSDSKKALPPTSQTSNTAPQDDEAEIKATEKKLNAIIAQEMNTSSLKFHIQLASFKQQEDARTFVAQLKNIDIDATVQPVNLVKIGTRYRVNTTAFTQQHQALRAKQLVEKTFGVSGIIITQ